MRLLCTLFRSGRALAAFLLLASLVAGEAADARHHLSEQGCAADGTGRVDHCICANLHAAPVAGAAVSQARPVECERELTPAPQALAPVVRTTRGAAPRAPPRD